MAHDIFVVVANFLGKNWMPKHITIGLFEAYESSRETLGISLQDLLEQYGLAKKIFACFKHEGGNPNTVIFILKVILSCEAFGCDRKF
jgi:hypothetical protein